MRALADVENTRRVGAERVEEAKKFAVQSFAKDMLEVADVLHMAVDNVCVLVNPERRRGR
jgi:molecular chaperone GrpE